MDPVTRYLEDHRDRFLETLRAVLRIPSVSTQPAHAADMVRCAEHVLPLFEDHQPLDGRPRGALEVARAWIRGEVPMRDAHQAAFRANAAARGMPDPAKFAALSAGQAVAVAHVAAHDLGAAAYAIRAAGANVPAAEAASARATEREWQRAQLPSAVRDLVLDDQHRRSAICWNVFDD